MKSIHVCIKTVLGLENLFTIVTSVNFTKMVTFTVVSQDISSFTNLNIKSTKHWERPFYQMLYFSITLHNSLYF